jgi:predicted DCC family thiol-disulfide oxidoreductase YuxK
VVPLRNIADHCHNPSGTYLWFMEKSPLRVLYNDSCPVCRTEIRHYQEQSQKLGLPITYDDLNQCDLSDWGAAPDEAARRLHVRRGDQLLTGVDAFIALWSELPRYRWLAKVVATPGIRHVATMIYDRALAPALYRAHLRRQRKQCSGEHKPDK